MNSTELKKILDGLYNTLDSLNQHGGIKEHSINTGQTDIRVQYSSLSEITKAIREYERRYQEALREEQGNTIFAIRDE